MKEFCEKYLEYLNTELKGLNLTRITDPEEFYYKQVLDSIKPLEVSEMFHVEQSKKGLVLDIGFGGGFPILPLAYKLPNVQFVGIDTRKKKVDAVRRLAKHLGLKNATFIHERIENIVIDRECVVTFKAVGTVEDCLNWVKASVPVGVYFYKGPELYEKEDLKKISKNWKKIENKTYEIPGTKGRIFLGFENISFKNSKLAAQKYLSELLKA